MRRWWQGGSVEGQRPLAAGLNHRSVVGASVGGGGGRRSGKGCDSRPGQWVGEGEARSMRTEGEGMGS